MNIQLEVEKEEFDEELSGDLSDTNNLIAWYRQALTLAYGNQEAESRLQQKIMYLIEKSDYFTHTEFYNIQWYILSINSEIYRNHGNYERALMSEQKRLCYARISSHRAHSLNNIARDLYMLGRYEESAENADKAMKEWPLELGFNDEILVTLTLALDKCNQNKKAIGLLNDRIKEIDLGNTLNTLVTYYLVDEDFRTIIRNNSDILYKFEPFDNKME